MSSNRKPLAPDSRKSTGRRSTKPSGRKDLIPGDTAAQARSTGVPASRRTRKQASKAPSLTAEELIERYDNQLRKTCATFAQDYGWSREQREDAEQECRTKLLILHSRNFSAYDPTKGPFDGWIHSVIIHKCQDVLRILQRRGKRVEYGEDNHTFSKLPAPGNLASEVASSRFVSTMLSALSEVQQKIVTLHLGFGGEPHGLRRVATMVGVGEAQARFEFESAITKLRRLSDQAAAMVPGLTDDA